MLTMVPQHEDVNFDMPPIKFVRQPSLPLMCRVVWSHAVCLIACPHTGHANGH